MNYLKKNPDMTEEEYLWKVGLLVDSGEYKSWESILSMVNKEVLGDDETLYRSESAWRKRYQAAKHFFDNCFVKMINSDSISDANRELEKNKIKYRDERRAWNKQNYIAARIDETFDILKENLRNFGASNFCGKPISDLNNEESMIVCLSDLHIGQTFKSEFGEYNTEIAKKRLNEYLRNVIDIADSNNISNIYVALLGDGISNSLHKTIQITNKENVVDQIKKSIELISSFVGELLNRFNVYFLSVSGNHSRLDKKDDSLHDERLDSLIAWSVDRTLSHCENYHSLLKEGFVDDGIAYADIHGIKYYFIHGDFDDLTNSGYMKLASMLHDFPDYVVRGHKHYCLFDQSTRFIQSGSIAGCGDSYTIEHRLEGKPSQMVIITNKNGVKAAYPVVLQD